jgi:tetratricopeptide (TPR) repeat protein
MKKTILVIFSILSTTYAVDISKCDKCTFAKAYMRCSYYVEKNADLSKQDSCLVYAQSLEEGNSKGRASWYYLVGGDFKSAIKAGENALKVGEKFAAEHIAEAYILQGNSEKAKKYFSMIDSENKDINLMVQKHFEILNRVHPDKFNIKTVDKLYKK